MGQIQVLRNIQLTKNVQLTKIFQATVNLRAHVGDLCSKTKVFSSSPAPGYVQRWALCSNRPANV